MKKIISITLSAVIAMGVFASCAGKPSTSGQTSIPASIPPVSSAPSEPEIVYNANPYTGYEKDSAFPQGQRATAVMVNNVASSRPQRGLSEAPILIETKVEGGITRFMAFFEDYKTMPDVGPVRSARDQFFRIAYPFQPLYIHVGRSGITQTYIDTVEYGDLNVDGNDTPITYFDDARHNQGFEREHCSYTNAKVIGKHIDKYNVDMNRDYNAPLFNFVKYDENNGEREMTGSVAEKISIVHSYSYRTYFDYNSTENLYKMSQYSSSKRARHDTIDENNGQQLGFDNVIVVFAEITTYPYPGGNLDKNGVDKGDPNYQNVHMDDGGVGFYFSKGKCEEIRWTKGSIENRLWFTNLDGTDLQINCGKSYIGVVSLDEYEEGFEYGAAQEVVSESIPTTGGNEVELGD